MTIPRFSLRWLLIGFTLLAGLFYVLFVQPTVIANRLARAVENQDATVLSSLVTNTSSNALFQYTFHSAENVKASVQLESRSWADVVRFQRRLQIQLSPDPNPLPGWSATTRVVTGITGIRYSETKATYLF